MDAPRHEPPPSPGVTPLPLPPLELAAPLLLPAPELPPEPPPPPPLLPPLPPPPLPPPLLESLPASPAAALPAELLLQLGMAARAASAARMTPLFTMTESLALSSLLRLRDVDLLCLDAGNTVVFLDHRRLAHVCADVGFTTDAATLVRAEGEAKVALEERRALAPEWSNAHLAGARGWAGYLGTLLHAAGLPLERLPSMLDVLWQDHLALNLWSLVPQGLPQALGAARAAGVRVAIVSNSEGHLDALLVRLGVRESLDLVIDSAIVGVEKPDPRIFEIALHHFGVPASRALHLGDVYATDVLGARAAGIPVALVDPFGHLAGRHPDVPRVPGAGEVAHALAAARSGEC
jgi:putative hydrolase of the HAD superfamily